MAGKAGFGSRSAAVSGRRRRGALALALGVLGAALFASPALAVPQVNGVFTVTHVDLENQITQGPDGNIWVTLNEVTGDDVARITPAGQVTRFDLATVLNPVGITSQGNNLWVTWTNHVSRFAPGSTTTQSTMINEIGTAAHITVGPDNNLWTVGPTGAIRINPANPTINTQFGVLTQGRQIVRGAGNTLWATGADKVVHFTTAGAHVPNSPYTLPPGAGASNPQGIAAGPGNQVAFGNPTSDPQTIGRITPPGPPQLTNLGNLDAGFGVAFANDGAYWITQANGNNLRRFTPQGQSTFLGGFPALPNRGPRQITTGPNNTLWVTLVDNDPMNAANDRVARVTGVEPTPPQPPPNGCTDNEFEFAKAKKNRKKGTAKLPVGVPCAGEVELAKTKKVKADAEAAEAEGEVKLLVKSKGKARKRLNKRGKTKVKAEVTYTPDGGEPNTRTKKVKLKRRR